MLELEGQIKIFDFSYHGYHIVPIRIHYIDILRFSIETLYQSKYFLLLSFPFSPNEHKDTDVSRAQDSGFLCLLWSSNEITREKILSSSAV